MVTTLIVAVVLLALLVLLLGFLLVGVLRALAHLRWRMDQLEVVTPSRIGRNGLKPGKNAPSFTLPSTDGGQISLTDCAGSKVFLVFMQAGCGPCQRVVPELNRLRARHDLRIVVVFNGALQTARTWARQEGVQVPVLAQENYAVSRRFEVFATPFAFLIDEQGVVRSKGIVSQREHIEFVLSPENAAESQEHVADPSSEPEASRS